MVSTFRRLGLGSLGAKREHVARHLAKRSVARRALRRAQESRRNRVLALPLSSFVLPHVSRRSLGSEGKHGSVDLEANATRRVHSTTPNVQATETRCAFRSPGRSSLLSSQSVERRQTVGFGRAKRVCLALFVQASRRDYCKRRPIVALNVRGIPRFNVESAIRFASTTGVLPRDWLPVSLAPRRLGIRYDCRAFLRALRSDQRTRCASLGANQESDLQASLSR